MQERRRTKPDLTINSPLHIAAASKGENYYSWQYNVADHFKGKSTDEIRISLKDTAFPYAVLMENWNSDFNFSSLIRNANSFNAKEVFYLGDKRFDKRGAVGSYNYTDVEWIATIEDLFKLKDEYVFVAIDNVAGSVPLTTYDWAPNSLMIFGSEGVGLTPTMLSMCKDIVSITQYGSVRSLNCAVASGICMYDFISKYELLMTKAVSF